MGALLYTLMQGHSVSAKAKHQRRMLSATKQEISIQFATTVGYLLRDLGFDFANVYMACPSCSSLYLTVTYRTPTLRQIFNVSVSRRRQ